LRPLIIDYVTDVIYCISGSWYYGISSAFMYLLASIYVTFHWRDIITIDAL